MEVEYIGNTQIIHMEENRITQQTIGFKSILRSHCITHLTLERLALQCFVTKNECVAEQSMSYIIGSQRLWKIRHILLL